VPTSSAHHRAYAVAVVAFALASLGAGEAGARDRRVAVTVDGAGCVAQMDLRSAVVTRGGHVDDDAPVRLRASVSREGTERIAVVVEGESERGAIAERRLVAASCPEALDALALLVALAADEADEAVEPTEPAEPAEPAPVLAAEPPPPAQPPLFASPRSTGQDAPPSLAPPLAFAETPSALYASVALAGSSLGEGQPGGRVALGRAWQRPILPWVEAGATANLPRAVAGGGGEASFVWLTARVAAAPLGARLAEGVDASVYGGVEGGALLAAGAGLARVESRARPWIAALAGGRLRWELGRRLVAGLDAGLALPLIRDQFVFVGGATVYRVPAVAFESALSLGVRFP
jgi:hypothetical protein